MAIENYSIQLLEITLSKHEVFRSVEVKMLKFFFGANVIIGLVCFQVKSLKTLPTLPGLLSFQLKYELSLKLSGGDCCAAFG